MYKILKYFFLKRMIKDPILSAQVYDLIYNGRKLPDYPVSIPKIQSIEVKPQVREVPTEKKELMESLNFLKSKSPKTKEDRDKISMLEVILKNKS